MSDANLARYGSQAKNSRGRLLPEQASQTRTVFQRDRDRIVHSTAFRRLEHKTQVFVHHEGDHYRSRLTHSIEVAQIARSISRQLGLNEDLAEALCLAHDLGHTPFGHAGEEALNGAMGQYGGFDHNAHTLRIVTKLETRYGDFDGLNLSWETLEGIVKHNGPLKEPFWEIEAFNKIYDLELKTYAGPEAQVASLADDIAYNNHDMDDAIRGDLIRLNDLSEIPLVGPIIGEITARYPGVEAGRAANEVVRRVIDSMVTDLIDETKKRAHALKPKSAQEVRDLTVPLVAFSESMQASHLALKQFLFDHVYRHPRVNRMSSKARRIVVKLFQFFNEEPDCLPWEWREATEGPETKKTAKVVGDYVAGMTDRYAMNEYAKLFNVSMESQ